MRLKVLSPTHTVVDQDVAKVIAKASNGAFALLPRHIDFVAPLVPGILTFETPGGEQTLLGHDEGTLVKCGDVVRVCVLNAIVGEDLAALEEQVEREFRHEEEFERSARSALARLEAGFVRRFVDLEK